MTDWLQFGLLLAALVVTPLPLGQTLYDGNSGELPQDQGFIYQAVNLSNPFQAAQATVSWADAAALLDTRAVAADAAGFQAKASVLPSLDSQRRITLRVALQIVEESHSSDDRAGFSILLLNSEAKGIELGFWADTIWAQSDSSAAEGIFHHAEEAAFDTTAQLTVYDLVLEDGQYQLLSNGELLLSGPLRDYSAFDGLINPYRTPNTLILSDNTSRGQAAVRMAAAAIAVTDETFIPIVIRP